MFNPLGPPKEREPSAEAQRRKDFNRAIAQLFSSRNGKVVLDYIRSKTIERPCCPAGSVEGYGYFREGQNDLVRQIETAIKLGKEGL